MDSLQDMVDGKGRTPALWEVEDVLTGAKIAAQEMNGEKCLEQVELAHALLERRAEEQ